MKPLVKWQVLVSVSVIVVIQLPKYLGWSIYNLITNNFEKFIIFSIYA